jgi:hypothetical protein
VEEEEEEEKEEEEEEEDTRTKARFKVADAACSIECATPSST